MNRTFSAAVMTLGLTLTATVAMANTQLTLDPHHTSATFHVKHLSISTVSGQIPLKTAHITLTPSGIPSSAEADFDIAKIETQDELRDKDLRGEKWFNTAQYPHMIFHSTSVTPGTGNTFVLKGLLDMHGQTHPVTLAGVFTGQAKDPMGKTHFGYSLTGTLERSAWGVGNAPPFMVGNDISIVIEAEAIQ